MNVPKVRSAFALAAATLIISNCVSTPEAKSTETQAKEEKASWWINAPLMEQSFEQNFRDRHSWWLGEDQP